MAAPVALLFARGFRRKLRLIGGRLGPLVGVGGLGYIRVLLPGRVGGILRLLRGILPIARLLRLLPGCLLVRRLLVPLLRVRLLVRLSLRGLGRVLLRVQIVLARLLPALTPVQVAVAPPDDEYILYTVQQIPDGHAVSSLPIPRALRPQGITSTLYASGPFFATCQNTRTVRPSYRKPLSTGSTCARLPSVDSTVTGTR